MPKGTPNFQDLATDVIDVLVANGWQHTGVSRAGFWTVTQLSKGQSSVEVYSPAGKQQSRVWLSPAKGGERAVKSALGPLQVAGIDPAERRAKGVRLVRVVRRSRAKQNPIRRARRNPGTTLSSAARRVPPALRRSRANPPGGFSGWRRNVDRYSGGIHRFAYEKGPTVKGVTARIDPDPFDSSAWDLSVGAGRHIVVLGKYTGIGAAKKDGDTAIARVEAGESPHDVADDFHHLRWKALRELYDAEDEQENPPLLQLASSRRKWSGDAARKALRKWATTKSGRINMRKYARGFMAVDGDPNNLGSYKLPYAIPIRTQGGAVRLRAVPRAIEAIAAVLDGARGGVELPPSQRRRARMFVARYYKKMGKVPPWRR